jgi:hypothetical protein
VGCSAKPRLIFSAKLADLSSRTTIASDSIPARAPAPPGELQRRAVPLAAKLVIDREGAHNSL